MRPIPDCLCQVCTSFLPLAIALYPHVEQIECPDCGAAIRLVEGEWLLVARFRLDLDEGLVWLG